MPGAGPEYHEVTGVIHCHSIFSDGGEDFPAIAAAANRAGLDYLLMTDHNTLAPHGRYGERRWGRTLVLVGAEITPRWNHYLVYNVRDLPGVHLPPQEYIDRVRNQGGIGFLAHPVEQGSPVLRLKAYGWQDWDVTGYTGIEIWNYFSSWVSGCTTLWRTLRGLIDWRHVDGDPDPGLLARWDELGRHRRVVGIGGVDAHGVRIRLLGPLAIPIHPYTRAFRTVRTHLLLSAPFSGAVETDRQLVLEALAAGRAFVANWLEGDPTGFRFRARTAAGWLQQGEEAPLAGPVELEAVRPAAPEGTVMRLLRDGRPLRETAGPELRLCVSEPGVYRVEVHRRGRGWIYSNPIYLRPPAAEGGKTADP